MWNQCSPACAAALNFRYRNIKRAQMVVDLRYRVIVEAAVHDVFVDKPAAAIRALKLGDSLDAMTKMGPVVSRRHQREVLGHIDGARASGATALAGGGVPDGAEFDGCFVEPTSGWDVHQPFGGFKNSGSPFKEQGLEGLKFYTRTKMTAIRFEW
jgi:acyl-CoA reductase-like NAD-dependent aldehyde dehydrogenase